MHKVQYTCSDISWNNQDFVSIHNPVGKVGDITFVSSPPFQFFLYLLHWHVHNSEKIELMSLAYEWMY